MSDALRQLLCEFVVEVDKAGALAKGNVEVEALKDRLHELQTILATIKVPAQRGAKVVQDVFARAAQQAQTNLAAIQAAQLGRGGGAGDQRGGFFAAGLAARKRDADAFATSIGGRLRAAFDRAGAGAAAFASRIGKPSDSPSKGSILGGMRGLLIAGAAIGAAKFAKGFIDQVGSIGEQAQVLGVTADEFQRLDVLAKQNNTSVQALGTAFRNLGKQAADPTKDSTAAFKALGVETKRQDGTFKSRQDLFFDTAGALADVSDETKRAQLATMLFGRSGTELLPILANGRAGLEAQRAELSKLAVISDANIKAADEFGDKWAATSAGLRAKLTPVLIKLIPIFEAGAKVVGRVFDVLTRSGNALTVWASRSRNAGTGAEVLGKALDALLFPLEAIEDFLVFMAGGDSVLGRRLDQMFGTNGQANVRKFAEGGLRVVLGLLNAIVTAVTQWQALMTATSFEAWSRGFLRATDDMGAALDRLFGKLAAIGQRLAVIPGLGFLGSAFQAPQAVGTAAGIAGTVSEVLPGGSAAIAPGPSIPIPMSSIPGGAGAFGGGMFSDQRTQSVTVNVASTAEVSGAVKGAQRGMGGRDMAASLAASEATP